MTQFANIITNPHFYVLLILAIMIIMIGGLIEYHRQPVLGATLKPSIRPKINLRHILFLLIYVYYGYHFPTSFVEFLVIAIFFKLIETAICRSNISKLNNNIIHKATTYLCEYERDYNQWSMIAVNMMAFVVGVAIYRFT